MRLARFAQGCVFAALALAASPAANPALAQDAPYSRKVSLRWTATSDELLDEVATEDIQINAQSAIQQFGQIFLPVNEHFAEMEISEAATIKPDGTIVAIAPDRILISTVPNSPQLGMFEADVKIRTMVFPDVAVGDTLHYVAKTQQKVNPLAGGFSAGFVVDPSRRFDKVEISLDVPETLKIQHSFVGFVESSSTTNGRRKYIWTDALRSFRAAERGATSPFDRDPRVLVSSYPDLEAIGAKFLEGAAPRSKPTPKIRALADEITRGMSDRKEQARAIFDWTTRNIRYLNVVLGAGGWEPHEAESVLAVKYGDCKDHATLMRALLASKGIEADYALINLAPIYEPYPIPFRGYDHVILYLPEFELYADPTATYSEFGNLPGEEADKPVLRAGKDGVKLARTPALRARDNHVSVKAELTMRPDGTASGAASTKASGSVSAALRMMVARSSLEGSAALAKQLLSQEGWHGGGEIELNDALDHADPYVVKTTFGLQDDFYDDGAPTSSVTAGPRLVVPFFFPFAAYVEGGFTQEFACPAGTYEQSIDIHLSAGQSLAKVPNDVHVASKLGTYDATYTVAGSTFFFGTGGTLHIARKFVSDVPGQVCTARTMETLEPVIRAAKRDFESILALKR
jgi:hypothetical protein